jgi:hypothetical protein
MTDGTSLFEHALGGLPRRALGYCTDDAGRALAVVARSDEPGAERLAERYLAFLVQAHEGGGRFRLRMGFDRTWTDDDASDDADGRALFGIGVAAAIAPWGYVRRAARALFEQAAAFRSSYSRATATAALGAAEVLRADRDCRAARRLLEDALGSLPRGSNDESWAWPEPRLAYANASLPEALIASGAAFDDEASLREGLRQLRWLSDEERLGDHLSFAPAGGRGPGDPKPGFDQQPIEAAALADACARAFDVTGDVSWLEPLALCVRWFEGSNDLGVPAFDVETGGGFDGLHPDRVNENQGAESTIAFLTTMQQARRLRAAGPRMAQRAASSASSS